MRRLLLPTCVVALVLVACDDSMRKGIPILTGPKVSDEEAIAAVLDDVHRGLQERQIYRVLAYISRAYHDEEGRDYEAVGALLSDFFKKYRGIRITRVRPRILVQGNRARVVETFGAVAESLSLSQDPPLSLQGQVTVYLEKTGNAWQIVEWGQVK